MRNFKFLRKSERKSVGTTLALTVGSPSAHRRYSALKHLAFMLLFLLGSLNVWGAEETYTFTDVSTPTTATTDGFTFTFDKGSGSTAPVWNAGSSEARLYAKGSLTIDGGENTITSIVFTYVVNKNKKGKAPTISSVSGTSNSGTWVESSKTWSDATGDNVIVFSTSGEAGNIGFKSVTITYSTGGGSEPSLSVSPTVIDFGTVDKDASVEAQEVTVTYENLTGAVAYSDLSGAFTASGTIAASGNKITITPNTANTGNFQQTLTVQSEADSKSAEVTVKMNVVEPFDGLALTFPDYNDKSVSGYTSSWTATKSGQVWTINNFNNNSNGWSFIKAGRNGNTSVATITTQVEDHAISDVTVTIDAVTAAKINSHKLYVADNSSFTDAIEISGDPATIAAGSIVYTVPVVNRANDLYYKLEFDCASGSSNGLLQISKITYAYASASPQKDPAGLAYDDSDLSNLVKLGDAFTAPTLTNPHSLTVAYESSNTDVAEVASNGALTIKAVGVAEITASSEETDTYKAGSAQYALYVVAHEGTEAEPYTVADARVVIDKVGETGIADQYVAGIVSNVKSLDPSKYPSAQYYISDNGERENEIYVYNGYYLSGANFTSADQLLEGDEVVVKGQILKYNKTTYEVAQGNQLVSLNRSKAAAGLAYTETAVEKNIGDPAFTNTLTNPNSLDVTYSSTVTGVATVDENGEVTIVGMGTTTIKASFAGNPSYLADEVSYTLTVEDPSLIKVTFDATIDKGESPLSKSNISLSCSNGVLNNESEYRLYKNSTTTFECSAGTIAKIEFIGVSGNPASGFAAPSEGNFVTDGNNATWTGNAASVSFVASGAQVRATKIFVSYREDTRAEAGLEYAETAVAKTVGDDAFINALTNPHSVAVTYESSNTDVAEVASDGTVTIKVQGTTTITASFEGNATYKPASVSYELTVNEAGLDYITFNAESDYTDDASTLTLSKGGFTLTFSDGVMNNKSEYRLYKNAKMTLSSADYYIKKIEFTCTSDNPISGFADATGLDKANNQWTGEANKVELTASNKQVRIEQMIVYYVEDTRAASGLAWSTDKVEITLGDDFTAASLVNPNNIDAAEITIESSNTNLAIVENGVVSLVEDVTGTATITATFAGNATYKPAEFSYTITVNDPTPMIYVQPSLNVNFGTVAKDASVDAKQITVTLQNVAAATAILGGTNPEAFSIDDTEIADGDVITISVASTATLGSYSATITITDNAAQAEQKVVNLSLSVEDVETPVSTESKWIAATEIADGVQVLIVSEDNGTFYAMSADRGNNRGVVAGTIEEGVFTPGANTMAFTLVAQDGGTYALRASNGKYLYAGGTGNSNWLNTKTYDGDLDANAKWNIDLTNSTIIATSSNRNDMRFNKSNNPKIISCYQSTSTYPTVALYVPKPVKYTVTFDKNDGSATTSVEVIKNEKVAQPEDPSRDGYTFNYWTLNAVEYDFNTPVTDNITLVANWTENPAPSTPDYTRNVTNGNYGTICLPKAGTIEGAKLFEVAYFDGSMIYVDEILGGEMAAGVPYIFQATSTQLNVTYNDNTDEPVVAGDANGLHGFYNLTDENATLPLADNASLGNYILYSNAYWLVSGRAAYIANYRAYIKLGEISTTAPEPTPGQAPRRRVAMTVHGEQVATGMDNVQGDNVQCTKVLIDGQLFIIRGEKMYDAKGQLVK